jgi:hypothetical protein
MKQAQILNKFKLNLGLPESEYYAAYHLKDIESNLFDKPYDGIDKRANALRSSAAMIYNTIGPKGNIITIGGIDYLVTEYEQKFPALSNADNPDHPHDAHIDVSLESAHKTELIFIEAKCLEWFDAPKSMSTAYLSARCYRPETDKNTANFIESFRRLRRYPEKEDPKDSSRLLPYYKTYDAIQMNIHILGIYNYCARGEAKGVKKIRLMNIVWDYYDAEEYRAEEHEGRKYVAFANKTFKKLFKDLGIDFSVEYVRYSEFLNRVDWSKDIARREYLKRYEI